MFFPGRFQCNLFCKHSSSLQLEVRVFCFTVLRQVAFIFLTVFRTGEVLKSESNHLWLPLPTPPFSIPANKEMVLNELMKQNGTKYQVDQLYVSWATCLPLWWKKYLSAGSCHQSQYKKLDLWSDTVYFLSGEYKTIIEQLSLSFPLLLLLSFLLSCPQESQVKYRAIDYILMSNYK